MNNPKCLICISYSEIWILNRFFWLNDGKIDWIGCRLQQNENSSAFWRWNIFRFPFCSDIMKYGFLVMFFFLSGKWNIVILKLSPGRTISSNGWISHGRHHLHACHECRKNIFKEKNPRKKLWDSTKIFTAMRKHSLQDNFCNNTFGTIWNYFLDWPHGTRFRIDTWTCSFTFHFVFIRRHFAHHSTFYFEA